MVFDFQRRNRILISIPSVALSIYLFISFHEYTYRWSNWIERSIKRTHTHGGRNLKRLVNHREIRGCLLHRHRWTRERSREGRASTSFAVSNNGKQFPATDKGAATSVGRRSLADAARFPPTLPPAKPKCEKKGREIHWRGQTSRWPSQEGRIPMKNQQAVPASCSIFTNSAGDEKKKRIAPSTSVEIRFAVRRSIRSEF